MSSLFRLVTQIDSENPFIGDIQKTNGQFVFLDEGQGMLLQRIKSKLLWWQGEWYLDQRQGTPWSRIVGKGGQKGRIESTLRPLIASIPGVAAVNSLEATVDAVNRTATVTFEVTSVEGYTVSIEALDLPYGVNS